MIVRKLIAAGFAAVLAGVAQTASADGPLITYEEPRGSCKPIPGKDYCELTGVRNFFVRAADGSTVQMKLVRRVASYKEVEQYSAQLGDKIRGRNKKEKENLDGASLVGLADAEGNLLEPTAYNQIFPISDRMALATAYLNESGSVFKYHLVPIDGKVTKSAGALGERNDFYYIGGHAPERPALVLAQGHYDQAIRRQEATLLDAFGKPKARFDNIIADNDFTFYMFTSGDIIVRAYHPETGEEGSMRLSGAGEVKGYGPKIAFKRILTSKNGPSYVSNALMVVGRLPVVTSLPDETLYHPLAEDGTKMPAPDNFIGMARLFTYDYRTAQPGRQMNWVLVYKTDAGFGYKVAGEGTQGQAYGMSLRSAQSVLKSEADYRMYSGFGFTMEEWDRTQPSKPHHAQYVVQEYSSYAPDGLTPSADASPGAWRDMTLSSASYTNLVGKDGENLGRQAYATPQAAFKAGWAETLAAREQKAEWERKLERNLAEARALAEQQRLERIKEMQWHFEQQQRYQPAQPRRESTMATLLQGLVAGLEGAAAAQNRANAALPRGYTRNCYTSGDGWETCYTTPRY